MAAIAPKEKKSKKKAGTVKTRTQQVGAAKFTKAKGIGLGDLMAHKMSWLAGYITVGNGTLGANDGVYYSDVSFTYNILNYVPVLGSDTYVGQGYVKDIEKHYQRRILRKRVLRLISLNPATTNQMMVCVAPIAGGGDVQNSSAVTTTAAAVTLANTIGIAGAKTAASYECLELDLTPYVKGGAGAKQNEFAINSTQASATAVGANPTGLVPCCVVVSGSNATSALRGTKTHMVVVEDVVDLVDFVGGVTNSFPTDFSSQVLAALAPKHKDGDVYTREEIRNRLLAMGRLDLVAKLDESNSKRTV